MKLPVSLPSIFDATRPPRFHRRFCRSGLRAGVEGSHKGVEEFFLGDDGRVCRDMHVRELEVRGWQRKLGSTLLDEGLFKHCGGEAIGP